MPIRPFSLRKKKLRSTKKKVLEKVYGKRTDENVAFISKIDEEKMIEDIACILKEHGQNIEKLRKLADQIVTDDIENIGKNVYECRTIIRNLLETGSSEINKFNYYALQSIVSTEIDPSEIPDILRWLITNNRDRASSLLNGIATMLDEDNCGYLMHILLLREGTKDEINELLQSWEINAKKRQSGQYFEKTILQEYIKEKVSNRDL